MVTGDPGATSSEYVDVTQLWLADGACDELAGHCQSLRESLGAKIAQLARLAPVTHAVFGDCEEGRGWSRIVQDRATGPTGSLTSVLEQHQIVLAEFAATIRRIGVAYRATDENSADRYARRQTGPRP